MNKEMLHFESEDQLQIEIKNAILPTTNAVFKFISKQHIIVDNFNKSHILKAALELAESKSISTYINKELQKARLNILGNNENIVY